MFLTTVLLFLLATTVSSKRSSCETNEEYQECGTACPLTCADNGPRPCTRQCVSGCFCKEGFVLDREGGQCVPKAQCKQRFCGMNEEYQECGTACPETCDDNGPKPCTRQCVAGCFCREGFVLDKEGGKCVPKAQCKQRRCGVNREFKQCGTACPETCADNGPKVCTKQCVEGCFCKEGFVLDREGGQCVPKAQCKQRRCGVNREFRQCGTACPKTCADKGPKPCTKQCVAGCFCKRGFVLDREGGKCIRKWHCKRQIFERPAPQRCPRNEVYKECGTACEPTCALRSPAICTANCVSGCFCKPGYIRTRKGGKCVPEFGHGCRGYCGVNQLFKPCGTACPEKCGDDGPVPCTKQCVPGCFCKEGYLLSLFGGQCVRKSKCDDKWE